MRAAPQNVVRCEPMAEVETPGRADVVAFLERRGFVEGHPEFDDVMSGYDQIATDPLDFDRLSTFLDRQLGEPAAPPPDGDEEEEYE